MICTNETLTNVKDSFSNGNVFYYDTKHFTITKTGHDILYVLQDKHDALESQMFTSLEDLISFLTSLPRKNKQSNCLDFSGNFPRLGSWGAGRDMRAYFMGTETHRQSHGRVGKVKESVCPECYRILKNNFKCECK